jgi:hypothetical protein
MVNTKEKLDGIFDPFVEESMKGLVTLSGDGAFDTLDRLLRRITPKRLGESIELLEFIRFFGGRVEFLTEEDFDDDQLKEEWCYGNEQGRKTLGSYDQISHWVTVPLDRHKGWGTVETTLRHELIHLLQDATGKGDRTTMELELLTEKMRWGDDLAKSLREHHAEHGDEDFPLCEVEAHCLDTWKQCVKDWAREVQRRTELWEGTWFCPV